MRKLNTARLRQSSAQMRALASVQKDIGRHAPSSGRKYVREFAQAFRSYEAVLTPGELEGRISAADVLLIGDYHALPASQRFAADLIERLCLQRPVVVGVEAVLARDQHILDAWWRREISDEELRRRLRFERNWGYEWDPFFELLVTARDHGEGLFGLDCMPREDLRRIRVRDRHAAAKLSEIRQRHPRAAIAVLFGESHMAPQNLPRLLRQAMPQEHVLTLLQNVDALYWQAIGEKAAAVSLGPDTACVFNASPLEKYESYRLCIERWRGDDRPDLAPAVYNVIFTLARCFGFRLHSPSNGTQPKYLADLLPEIVHSADVQDASDYVRDSSPESDRCDLGRLSKEHTSRLEEHGCAYVAETNRFYIREFNMARVAAEATRFLYRACAGTANRDSASAQRKEDAIADFGARLLCPVQEKSEQNRDSEELYQAYIAGKITKAEIRKLFLANDSEHSSKRKLSFAAGR
jgi:hypothetical protein